MPSSSFQDLEQASRFADNYGSVSTSAVHQENAQQQGGSVTLIFRQIEPRWRDEYFLNLAAAFATGGDISHVEIAIGNQAGSDGHQMANVLRIYNDAVGVELCQRTGKSPNYRYLQLGCTKQSEQVMLDFARNQIGKPFNSWAMARSIIWPRKSTKKDYFCAGATENLDSVCVGGVVAGEGWKIDVRFACVGRVGGRYSTSGRTHVRGDHRPSHANGALRKYRLCFVVVVDGRSRDSNPGAATPQSLYKLYEPNSTTTGNPFVLRTIRSKPSSSRNIGGHTISSTRGTQKATIKYNMIPQTSMALQSHSQSVSVPQPHALARNGNHHHHHHQPPQLCVSSSGHANNCNNGSLAEQAIRNAVRGACSRLTIQ